MTLLGQSVFRGPDGTRWVVNTQASGDGFVTTARKTGCDLRPEATAHSHTVEDARAAHQRYVAAIQREGRPPEGD